MSPVLERKNNLISVVVAAVFTLSAFTTGISVAQEKTLYERLGGYDAISAVVDDFAGKLFIDPVAGELVFTLQPGVGRGRRNALSK